MGNWKVITICVSLMMLGLFFFEAGSIGGLLWIIGLGLFIYISPVIHPSFGAVGEYGNVLKYKVKLKDNTISSIKYFEEETSLKTAFNNVLTSQKNALNEPIDDSNITIISFKKGTNPYLKN